MTLPAISVLTPIEQLTVPPFAKPLVSTECCQLFSQGIWRLAAPSGVDPTPLTCPLLHSGDSFLGVAKMSFQGQALQMRVH